MVSPPNAAAVSPDRAALVFPSLKNAVAPSPAAGFVPKQNTPGVPKPHVASFQNFADALRTALSRSEATPYVEDSAAVVVTSDGSVAPRTPRAPVCAPEENSGTGVNSTRETPAPPHQHNGTDQADRNGTASDDAGPKRALQVEGRVRPAAANIEKVEPKGDSPQAHPQVNGNATTAQFIAAPAEIDRVPTENGIFSSPDHQQLDRVNHAQCSGGPVQDERVSEPYSGAASETEAFRIDLHPNADRLEESCSTSRSSDLMASNETLQTLPVPRPAAVPSAENVQQIAGTESLPIERSGREKPDSAAPSDRAANGRAAESPSPWRKQQASAGPDENKLGEKATGDAAVEMSRGSMSAGGTSFDNAFRNSGAPREPLEGARPGETPKTAEGLAPNEAREVLVRFQSGPGEVVTVRLLDQGGQIQVAVRSTDPVAAAQLRQDLGSLTNSLERSGWKADPATVATPQHFAAYDALRSRADAEGGGNRSNPDWHEGGENKKRPSSELWDVVFANQDA